SQHTQGECPMKGAVDRVSSHGHKVWRAALIGLLLPIAVGSAAQTPGSAPTVATAASPAPALPVQSAPVGVQPVSVINPNPLPVADGFDVRKFEDMAQQLVADQRIPGMAMAIVKNGRIVSLRGYGITDTRAAEPIDSHTV